MSRIPRRLKAVIIPALLLLGCNSSLVDSSLPEVRNPGIAPPAPPAFTELDRLKRNCLRGQDPACERYHLIERDINAKVDHFSEACSKGTLLACRYFAINSPARQISTWQASSLFQIPTEQRLTPTPPGFLADYVTLEAKVKKFKTIPRVTDVSADFARDLRAAWNDIPRQLHHAVQHKLLGIFTMEGLGSSGITYDILDAKENPIAGVIILDPNLLNKLANDWASFREMSPYESGDWKAEVQIAAPHENLRKLAIQYVLLHELAHVLSIGETFLPRFGARLAPGQEQEFEFMALSWKSLSGRSASIFDSTFPERGHLSFYGRNLTLQPNATLPLIAKSLTKTSFVTTYATLNPQDDFAESFTHFVWTQWLKRPYRVKISKKNLITDEFAFDWNSPQLRAKRLFLESSLNRWVK